MKYIVEFSLAGKDNWTPLMDEDMYNNYKDALAAIADAIWADDCNDCLGVWDYKISEKSS